MRALLCVLVCLLVSSCATDNQLTKESIFTESSATGLIVFGLLRTDNSIPSLNFRKYDPITKSISTKETFSATPEGAQNRSMLGQRAKPGEYSYFVLEMPEGDWFLEWVGSQGSSSNESILSYLTSGTIAFKATAGKATYIGEYSIGGKFGGANLTKLPSNLSSAQSHIQSFENVNASLSSQDVKPILFSCVKNTMPFTPRCDYTNGKVIFLKTKLSD